MAFLVYQNTINRIIKDYVIGSKNIANADAHQLYEDVIYPKLCELDNQIKIIKKAAIKQLIRDITIGTAAVAVGVFSGIVPSTLQPIFGGFASIRALTA